MDACGSTLLEPLYAITLSFKPSLHGDLTTYPLRNAEHTRRLVLLLSHFQRIYFWSLFRRTMVCHLPTRIYSVYIMVLAICLQKL